MYAYDEITDRWGQMTLTPLRNPLLQAEQLEARSPHVLPAALITAIINGEEELMRALLERGASANSTDACFDDEPVTKVTSRRACQAF